MPPAVLTVLLLQTAPADSATLRHANGLIPQTVTAVRVPRAPVLDGKLDDPAWRLAAAPVTNFRQTDPDEGKPASESTAVLVVYDDHAIYVGARLFDSEPRRIAKRLVRRDADSQSDEFRVLFDSYHDHRTAYRFVVNPAGVKATSSGVTTAGSPTTPGTRYGRRPWLSTRSAGQPRSGFPSPSSGSRTPPSKCGGCASCAGSSASKSSTCSRSWARPRPASPRASPTSWGYATSRRPC